MKDNEEEIRAEELRLLEQYITANNITVSPTESGLYYIELEAGSGLYPKLTDWVEVSYTVRLLSTNAVVMSSDSTIAAENEIYSEFTLYGPNRVRLNSITITGLLEGLSKMKGGGKAKIIFPSSLGFGNVPFGKIPAYSSLIFEVELHHVITDISLFERALMNSYLTTNSFILPDSTATGLYYKEILNGSGETPVIGDLVEILYQGSFLNGKVFDKTESDESHSFYIGYNQVISGIDEGVKLMKKGGKAKMIIPYYLAYGADGYVHTYYGTLVWPYSTLVFDVELLNITKSIP